MLGFWKVDLGDTWEGKLARAEGGSAQPWEPSGGGGSRCAICGLAQAPGRGMWMQRGSEPPSPPQDSDLPRRGRLLRWWLPRLSLPTGSPRVQLLKHLPWESSITHCGFLASWAYLVIQQTLARHPLKVRGMPDIHSEQGMLLVWVRGPGESGLHKGT
jgi:hypothetical protein